MSLKTQVQLTASTKARCVTQVLVQKEIGLFRCLPGKMVDSYFKDHLPFLLKRDREKGVFFYPIICLAFVTLEPYQFLFPVFGG